MNTFIQFFRILTSILLVNHPGLRLRAWGKMLSLLTTPLVTLVVQKGVYKVTQVSEHDPMNPAWYSYREHAWEYKAYGFRLVASAKYAHGVWDEIDFWIYAGKEPVLNIFQPNQYEEEEVMHLYRYRAFRRYAKAWKEVVQNA